MKLGIHITYGYTVTDKYFQNFRSKVKVVGRRKVKNVIWPMRYTFQDRPVSKFGPPIWNCDKSHFSQLPCIRRHNSVISQPITMKFGTHTGGAAGEVCHLWLPCCFWFSPYGSWLRIFRYILFWLVLSYRLVFFPCFLEICMISGPLVLICYWLVLVCCLGWPCLWFVLVFVWTGFFSYLLLFRVVGYIWLVVFSFGGSMGFFGLVAMSVVWHLLMLWIMW